MSLIAMQGGLIAAVTAPATAYLDELSPAPRVAYSLKKVISTATNAIRVRRSSDNAEQDIGFTGDALDTAALASFVGSDSAFVTTFYDQTSTGINFTQTTAANQPRIVNAGTFDGALIFDGFNDTMAAASVTFGATYAAAYMKAKQPNGALAIMLEASANYNSAVGSFIWYMESSNHSVGINGGVPWRRDYSITSISALTTITLRLQMAVSDGTQSQHRFRVGGTNIAPFNVQGTAASPPVNFTTQTIYLGSRGGSSFFAPIEVETLAIYAADTDAQVSAIEAIVGA